MLQLYPLLPFNLSNRWSRGFISNGQQFLEFAYYQYTLAISHNLGSQILHNYVTHINYKMQRSLQRAQTTHRTLRKVELEKTFPDILDRARKPRSSDTNDSSTMIQQTMREYQTKFYHDQIKLLLSRIQRINQKCEQKDGEIKELRHQLRDLNKTRKASVSYERSRLKNSSDDQNQEQATGYALSRLKNHYLVQIDKMKSEYEKKIKEKERQKNNACKALKFEHHCQIMEDRFQKQKIIKQKVLLEQELAILKAKAKQDIRIDQVVELQSYKQENALLRSFVYKMQMAERKTEKLEESRKKQRQQFVIYAEENQSEKRELLKNMEEIKNSYEQKISALHIDYDSRLKLKQQQIKGLRNQMEELKIRQKMRKSEVKAEIEKSVSQSMINYKCQNMRKSVQANMNLKISQMQWEGLEASLSAENQKKEQRLQILTIENDQLQTKQLLFHRQIERLRIERNNMAVENNILTQKLAQLKQELEGNNYEKGRQVVRSRLDQFDIPQVVSHIREGQLGESQSYLRYLEQNTKIIELEMALRTQQEKSEHMSKSYNAMQSLHKSKENSMKLTIDMSDHTYKQLWDKYCATITNLKSTQQNCNKLTEQINQLNVSLQNKEYVVRQCREEHELAEIECQTLHEKYATLQMQCQQNISQTNEKMEQVQIANLRYRKEIEGLQNQIDQMLQKMKQQQEQAQYHKEIMKKQQQDLQTAKQELGKINTEKMLCLMDINSYKQKQTLSAQYIEQVEKTMSSMRDEFRLTLAQKQKIISKLLSSSSLSRKASPQSQQLLNSNTALFEPLLNTVQSVDPNVEIMPTSILTLENFHTQICQINANHQSQIDHLKNYIQELVEENEELKNSYQQAAQSWREMYEGMLRYNQFVGQGNSRLQNSIARKRDHKEHNQKSMKDGNQKFKTLLKVNEQNRISIKNKLMFEKSNLDNSQNRSETFTVPDFSQRKPEHPLYLNEQNEAIEYTTSARLSVEKNLTRMLRKQSKDEQKSEMKIEKYQMNETYQRKNNKISQIYHNQELGEQQNCSETGNKQQNSVLFI